MSYFEDYQSENFFDEYFTSDSKPRDCVKELIERIDSLSEGELEAKQRAAELAFFNMGITFTLYNDALGLEKIFPFDILPRIIESAEWEKVEMGLRQRMEALNLFLNDIYNDQKIFKNKVIDRELIESGSAFRKELIGFKVPKNIWAHINGADLIRDKEGNFMVLEDNLRCPSGISYVLENRRIMKRIFPKVFETMKVRHINDYPTQLLRMLKFLSPNNKANPQIALLTPGIYNSAYFEHSFLAQQMGITLVEGRDLCVENDYLYMKCTEGLQKIDVLYRRIDDNFLDPKVFRADSVLGVSGLMQVYKAGKLSIVNAPGTGIADDKVVYKFVPEIIKYYLGENPILENVPSYLCSNHSELDFVLNNLENLVIKSANEAGGYGMLMGPQSTAEEREEFKLKILSNPRNFLAQPVINLSRVPCNISGNFEGRHVDLRPYILYGEEIYVLPGGLTRVALKKDSLIVNSSQGGGSKDTWVRTAY